MTVTSHAHPTAEAIVEASPQEWREETSWWTRMWTSASTAKAVSAETALLARFLIKSSYSLRRVAVEVWQKKKQTKKSTLPRILILG
jgi:urease accessory protein UreH